MGWAPGHHGELLQGAFDDGCGRVRRALVTLPQPDRGSRAVFHPSQSHWGVVGTPELVKVRRAAILALRQFAAHPAPAKGGQVEITSDVPRGIGMGSSTATSPRPSGRWPTTTGWRCPGRRSAGWPCWPSARPTRS